MQGACTTLHQGLDQALRCCFLTRTQITARTQKPAVSKTAFSQSFKLFKEKVPKSCIPTGFAVPLLFTPRPAARRSRGPAALRRGRVPAECGEFEWHASVDSFRAGRRDGSPAICCEPRGPIATAAQEWSCCFSSVKKFFPTLFPAPACARS